MTASHDTSAVTSCATPGDVEKPEAACQGPGTSLLGSPINPKASRDELASPGRGGESEKLVVDLGLLSRRGVDFRLFVVVLIGLAKFEDKPKARPCGNEGGATSFSQDSRVESGAHGHVRVI